jgi:hypothetical protein
MNPKLARSMEQSTCVVSLVSQCSVGFIYIILISAVTLPELIGQTNMDHQSVNRLKEELTKLTLWIEKNATNYFVSEYETPAQEYIDRARNA